MCGRYAVSADVDELTEIFEIDEVAGPLPGPDYNVAPTDPVPAIMERDRADGRRRVLAEVRWGLVPSWSKDATGAARLINARVETLAEKPAFRRAFAARRCLLPADGYYEWYQLPDSKTKQPYFIRPAEGGLLVMAGLYEFWKAPDGTWLATTTVITTAAADEVGHIHDRNADGGCAGELGGLARPGLRHGRARSAHRAGAKPYLLPGLDRREQGGQRRPGVDHAAELTNRAVRE